MSLLEVKRLVEPAYLQTHALICEDNYCFLWAHNYKAAVILKQE